MVFDKLESILQAVSDVGIDEIIIEPVGEKSLIRGTNSDNLIILFDHVGTKLFDHDIAIQGVKSFLSRIRLFDKDKVKLETELRNGDSTYISVLHLKQGRRKTTFRMGKPKSIHTVTHAPGVDNIAASFKLSKADIEKMLREIQSIGQTGSAIEQTITFQAENGEVHYSLYNGEDDKFDDKIQTDVDSFDPVVYDMKNFTRVLRKSLDVKKDEVEVKLIEIMALRFDMGDVDVILAPIG